MIFPDDQEKRFEASSSAVASKRVPLSNRPAPNKSSFAKLAREAEKGDFFFSVEDGPTPGLLGKLLCIPRKKAKFTRAPTGKLPLKVNNLNHN